MSFKGWAFFIGTTTVALAILYGPRAVPEPGSIFSIATVFVATVVALVQYAQWRTANQKVVIDLYDRRLQVFSKLEAAVSEVMRHGDVKGAAFQNFAIAQADARFLFGEDVQTYLAEMRKAYAWLSAFTDEVIDQAENPQSLINAKYKHIERISDFWKEATPIFAPYINLTMKSTPFWRPW